VKGFNNLKVAMKLAIGFGITLSLTAVVGLVGWLGMKEARTNVNVIDDKVVTNLQNLDDFNGAARQVRIFEDQVAIFDDEADIQEALKSVDKSRAEANKALEEYGKVASDPEEKDQLQKLSAAWDEYDQLFEKWKPIISDPKCTSKTDQKFSRETGSAFESKVVPLIDKLVDWNDKHSAAMAKRTEEAVQAASSRSITVLGVAIVIGIFLACMIAAAIVRPIVAIKQRLDQLNQDDLTSMASAMSAMEAGDLTVSARVTTLPADIHQKDEVGQMATTFNAMLDKTRDTFESYENMRASLSDIVRHLQHSATNVAGTSAQLEQASEQTGLAANSIAASMQEVATATDASAQSANQIAKGGEQLARSTTDAAGYMEILNEAIASVESGSQQQKKATDEAQEIATAGRESVGRTVSSMKRIQEQVEASSQAVRELGEKGQQIGQIVQTIEEIAQQTNLLALNAAIEAARAGEQGKGFAVVADEVRKLAERAASSTQEIGSLISSVRSGVDLAVAQMEASTSEVEAGAVNSEEAGDALERITIAVEQVTIATTQNAASIDKMATNAGKVSDAISSAAAVSEETASGAEEMSASAEEVAASTESVSAAIQEQTAQIEEVGASAVHLRQLAEELNEVARRFKVEDTKTVRVFAQAA